MRQNKSTKKLNTEDILTIALMAVCAAAGIVLYDFSKIDIQEQDMTAIRERIPLENPDTIDIFCGGSCVVGDEAIVWYVAGEEGDYYIPLECSVINYSEYQLVSYLEAASTNIDDIVYVPWKDGFAVMINNDSCTGYEAADLNGELFTVELDKGSVPHVMYVHDISSCSFFMI